MKKIGLLSNQAYLNKKIKKTVVCSLYTMYIMFVWKNLFHYLLLNDISIIMFKDNLRFITN